MSGVDFNDDELVTVRLILEHHLTLSKNVMNYGHLPTKDRVVAEMVNQYTSEALEKVEQEYVRRFRPR